MNNQFHTDQAPAEDLYLYQRVLPICKYYIELRYTLLRLFYGTTFENTLNGMPICRALFSINLKNKDLFNEKVSFLNTECPTIRNRLRWMCFMKNNGF